MSDTTVVGWKNNESSREAVEWAALRRPWTTLHIVHVVDRSVSTVETFAADSPAARARVELMEAAESVRSERPSLTVRTELLDGDLVDALTSLSGPDSLVAVGSGHGRFTGRSRSWSTGARLSGSASGPAAVVPTGTQAGSGIVVGMDDRSGAALRFAAAEARATGQWLRAVRAWEHPLATGDGITPDVELLREIEGMYGGSLADEVSAVADEFPDIDIRRSVVPGDPRDVLLAESAGASMLVVGNRGLSGLRRFFVGSVGHSLILGARIPTVVVRDAAR